MRNLKFTTLLSRTCICNFANTKYVSFFAFMTVAFSMGPVFAGEPNKIARPNQCASMGEGFMPIEGAEGCFRIGGHVRVETGVMRGTASLHDNANTSAYARPHGETELVNGLPAGRTRPVTRDGAVQAGYASESATGTTRLRMRPLTNTTQSR